MKTYDRTVAVCSTHEHWISVQTYGEIDPVERPWHWEVSEVLKDRNTGEPLYEPGAGAAVRYLGRTGEDPDRNLAVKAAIESHREICANPIEAPTRWLDDGP